MEDPTPISTQIRQLVQMLRGGTDGLNDKTGSLVLEALRNSIGSLHPTQKQAVLEQFPYKDQHDYIRLFFLSTNPDDHVRGGRCLLESAGIDEQLAVEKQERDAAGEEKERQAKEREEKMLDHADEGIGKTTKGREEFSNGELSLQVIRDWLRCDW